MTSKRAATITLIAAAALAVAFAGCSKNKPQPAHPQPAPQAEAGGPAAAPAGAKQAPAASAQDTAAGTAAPASGGKCAKVVDKMFSLAEAMILKSVAKDKAAQMKQQMKAKMAQQRPMAIAQCQQALKKHPKKAAKQIDCVLAAKTMADVKACGNGAKHGAM